jgi:hypothetical protein
MERQEAHGISWPSYNMERQEAPLHQSPSNAHGISCGPHTTWSARGTHYISRLPMHMASVAALIQHGAPRGTITLVAFQCTWHQLRPSYNMERQEATLHSRLPMHMASVAALIQHGAPRGTITLVAFQCTWHQLRPSYNMERQEAHYISRLPMHMASVAALIQHGAPRGTLH